MKFSIYLLKRPDGRVFYVGKGVLRKRITAHRNEAKRNHNCHRCRLIRALWRNGQDFTYEVVLQTNNEQEAFAKEKELIAYFGRANLTNLTDGGEGMSGYVLPLSTRRKLSERMRGNTYRLGYRHSPEIYAKLIAASHTLAANAKRGDSLRGRTLAESTRQKIRMLKIGKRVPKLQGKKLSPERIDKMRAARKAKGFGPLSEAHRLAIAQAITGRMMPVETRQRISDALKGNKNGRGNRGKRMNRGPLTAEHRLHLSESAKKRGISPETRKKIADALRGKKHTKRRAHVTLSEAHRQAISKALTGRTVSQATRQKIREAHLRKSNKPYRVRAEQLALNF